MNLSEPPKTSNEKKMAGLCRDCLTGTIQHDANPKGSEQTLHGLPTYVTAPEPGAEPLGTVVIITDAFGWEFPNTRSLADAYARRVPCTVYIPDFMNGQLTSSVTDQGVSRPLIANMPQATPSQRKLSP